jgi:hypothetical protein
MGWGGVCDRWTWLESSHGGLSLSVLGSIPILARLYKQYEASIARGIPCYSVMRPEGPKALTVEVTVP